jgi:hypothetical protein
MSLKQILSRPAPRANGISKFRSPVNPLARVKTEFQSAKAASEAHTQSQIKQLSQDRTRLNRAIPAANDPVKTSLNRRGDLVGNRIGWLQSLLPKK